MSTSSKPRETNTLAEDFEFPLPAMDDSLAIKAVADLVLYSLIVAALSNDRSQKAVRPKYIVLDDGWSVLPQEVSK